MTARRLSVVGLLVLLCGATAALTANSATNTAAVVKVAKTSLGPVLVDGSGRTLYLFTLDRKGSSSCTTGSFNCIVLWPPLLTTAKPHAGPGVSPALLGTVRRAKPSGVQVTYNGHFLYRYAQDTKPGDVKGQGYGSVWYVVSPKGTPIKRK